MWRRSTASITRSIETETAPERFIAAEIHSLADEREPISGIVVVYNETDSMSIDFTISVKGEMLSAIASGSHVNEDDLQRYGLAIVETGLRDLCTKVLLDERNLDHDVTEGYVYYLAERYSSRVRRPVRVAIVFDESFPGNIAFWENCAVNRGLRVSVFKSPEQALSWLNEEARKRLD